jgi:MinD superfamily P-loop ATPase
MTHRESAIRQIVIVSGKGGTGKTMLTASLAFLAKNKVLVDCDVDAANLYLLLRPKIIRSESFVGGMKASSDRDLCSRCSLCRTVCRFDAIGDDYSVSSMDCEGCGFCAQVCPARAITMNETVSGEWFISETAYGCFVHAKLGAAEGNSGKLVSVIRQAALKIAKNEGKTRVIIDGPPGIGCPVIASLSGADLAVVVTEPTPTGIHDMERVFSLARQFGTTLKVVINKFDLNWENSEFIHSFCSAHRVEVIGRIPFSAEISKAIVQGVPPVEFCGDPVRKEMVSIWSQIERHDR